MLQNATYLALKNANNFYCETCSFACSKKSNYDKHNLTTKHKNATFMLHNATSNDEYGAKTSSGIKKCRKNAVSYCVCSCGRTFQHRSSLWRHKKGCFVSEEDNIVTTYDNNETCSDEGNNIPVNDNKTDFKELVLLLLKENKEIQKKINEEFSLKDTFEDLFNEEFTEEICNTADLYNCTDILKRLGYSTTNINKKLRNDLASFLRKKGFPCRKEGPKWRLVSRKKEVKENESNVQEEDY